MFLIRHYFIGLIKSIVVNFRYLPLRQAIKLPILISGYCSVKGNGNIMITTSDVYFAMIKLGFGNIGLFDHKFERTIIFNHGLIDFCGRANIGLGSRIAVSGILRLGEGFAISAKSQIVAMKEVVFGKNCLISWDVLVMDSDFHPIYTLDDYVGARLNPDKPIYCGDNCWICTGAKILKGSKLSDNVVIAAGASISSDLSHLTNSILTSNNIEVKELRKNIVWKL